MSPAANPSRGIAWWAFPVLFGVLLRPEMVLAHEAEGARGDTILWALVSIVCAVGSALFLAIFTPETRRDRIVQIGLVVSGLAHAALAALFLVSPVADRELAQSDSTIPTQIKEIWP